MSILLLANPRLAAQNPATEERGRQLYQEAKLRFSESRTDVTAAWQLGRAAFDLADLLDESSEHRQIAQTGIDACRHALSLDPNSAPAHYYLALDLGQMAREKKFGALRLLREMERELEAALKLDPALDYSGPDRSLGMLYLEAPSWPASVGSRNKARLHLQAAVDRNPQYPENRLCLAEAYAKWGESKNLERELKLMSQGLQAAQQSFDRKTWAANWKDWETRLQKLQKSQEQLANRPSGSPSDRGARHR